jgi:predicted RNA methylase
MNRSERDDQFAAHLPSVLHYHQMMLADGVCNKILYKAVKQNVTPETSFLDIRAGTGVLAFLAAKLGAKRVVAVEIEIIHANSNDVKIRGRFDVIVSELSPAPRV